MDEKIKILIVDDSITYRQIILKVIEKIPDAECIGTAGSGEVALKKIDTLQPDLVLLDIVMPDMDGVETLQQIKQKYPHIEAIMISSFDMKNAKETLRSLQIGALDFIAKPKTNRAEEGIAGLVNYLTPLINLAHTKKYARLNRPLPQNLSTILPKKVPAELPARLLAAKVNRKKNKADLIVIGISTGGPKALDQLIPNLNPAMPCPVLIVQHMPPMFTESLAMKLNEATALTVIEAKGGEKLQNGFIYIAPGGKHLILREHLAGGYYLAVNETPPVNNCRPSVDVLFRSVATTFKGQVLAIIMTGMGRDGTDGIRMLKRNGGQCFIQDEESSVVWGMPGSVYEAGLADEILSLSQISTRINESV